MRPPYRPWRQLRTSLLGCLLLVTGGFALAEEVTIAAFDGAAPIVFVDHEGNASGIMPELLGQILADMGYKATFVTGLSFQEAYRGVTTGTIDLLPGAARTEDRLRLLDFNNEPLVVAWGQLGVLPGQDIDGLLELRNRRIGLMRSGQNAANFIDLMKRFDIPFVPVYFDDFGEITKAIENKDVVAGVFFNAWFRTARSIVPSSIVFSPTQGFVATAKGTNYALLHAIDERLLLLKQDPGSYYYDILDRWLSRTENHHLPRWVWITGGAILGALLLALFFLLLLRRQVRVATAEVELSRQRYRTIADYAHGWEFWADPEGAFIYVSPNTEEITGYPALRFYEDQGLLKRIIHPDDLPLWQRHLEAIHAPGGEERASCLFRIKTRDGETRWMEHRCNSVTSADGGYLGRRGSNIDITERVLQQQALEKSLLEKEVMLQEIHHRVKNNLQMVASLIALQKHSISDTTVLKQLESISGRINTMGNLHSTIYREESFGRVEMKEYVASIVSQIRATLDPAAVIEVHLSIAEIELELSTALPCGLIINEAVTNAFKYAFPEESDGDRASGEIVVSLEPVDQTLWRLLVTDNGRGLPTVTTARPREGVGGIGFQLIMALSEQLGGEATWRSDGGTRVEVLFPREDKVAPPEVGGGVRTGETPQAR